MGWLLIIPVFAQARRRRREALAKALQATFERLQLYAHGTRCGAWDKATQQALQRHLVRNLGADAVDQLLLHQQVDPNRLAQLRHIWLIFQASQKCSLAVVAMSAQPRNCHACLVAVVKLTSLRHCNCGCMVH